MLVFVKDLGRVSGPIGSVLRERHSLMLDSTVFAAAVSRGAIDEDILVGDVGNDRKPQPFNATTSCCIAVRAKALITEGDRMVELASLAEIRELRDHLDRIIATATKGAKSLKRNCDLL